MTLNQKKYNTSELNGGERPLRLQHRFLVLRKLGQGTYGKVQLALNKETNEEVAVKTIKKVKIENEEDMLRIRREIYIMTSIRHPHIIHINEVFETRQKIVIVMQYASGGELYDYLGCHQTLPEDEARRIFRQIASAIYYCHKNQICHRDLKLENILLDEEGNAKIADFGLSNIFDDKRRMNTFCGSPLYASPEIVKGTPYKGPEVDCWSLGVLLYTLVYGTMPFDGRNFKELVSQISEGKYEEPINRSNASSLIRWLLTPDISRRATITDVCKDSWVNHGCETSLFEIAENMASTTGAPREYTNSSKLYLEINTKNGREKSIFQKAAAQLEEKAGKFTSRFTKNFENITKTKDSNSEAQKCTLYEQITNYDVRFVLNKLISAVEASLTADKNGRNFTTVKDFPSTPCNVQKRKESIIQKIDSAYVIPIFEVTSTIPNEKVKMRDERSTLKINTNGMPQRSSVSRIEKEAIQNNIQKKQSPRNICINEAGSNSKLKNSLQESDIRNKNLLSVNGELRNKTLLTESQKQLYTLDIAGRPDFHKTDLQSKKLNEQEHLFHRHPSPKAKHMNDGLTFDKKHPGPFMRTKHHVLSLARLLSLNYERLMRNSFRMPSCKKKLPGKITIPATFDPNNPPAVTKKLQEEKKDLLIFPTVSVSENKVKIEKKIDKIKKAALNKNIIIRSDSKTRLRIEKYILSQVKKIQDLVCDEQRSIHASLEHLEEQSFRDMSEMYYCTFGSENTDSGIANTEDEEYFCFLCSKPNESKDSSSFVDSFVIDSIKKGNLYTSNHLHIPRNEHNKWKYASANCNTELGALSRCKSEIKFPTEYLNYISPSNKSDLSKRSYQRQQIQKNNISNTKCFLTVSSTSKADDCNSRILRSASDSFGLHLNKENFEIVKLNTDGHDDVLLSYSKHFLEQALPSNRCNYSQMTDSYETQTSKVAKDHSKFNTHMLDKDDGIGDSNDSFQSYMETFENNISSTSVISESKSYHSLSNFSKENLSTNLNHTKRLLSEPYLKYKYDNEDEDLQTECYERGTKSIEKILDSDDWAAILENEIRYDQYKSRNKGLRRRNTMTCIGDKNETDEHFIFDTNNTEFDNYLWNAYKEHLLETDQSDTEFVSAPNLNYHSLDRRTKFRQRDTKSLDFNNREHSCDFYSANYPNCLSPSENDASEPSRTSLRNILHSNASKSLPERSGGRLSRTKSIASEFLSENDREDVVRKLKTERKLSQGSCIAYDKNNGLRKPFFSNFLNDLETRDQERKADKDPNRKHYSKNSLPIKRSKSEYKKSFLQLLALKRIQEAEKELDKTHRNDFLDVEDESSGSLLEALKTHGYKTVISQRFQDTNSDDLYPLHTKYLKSPRNLRAEIAQLNHMYYESLPKYSFDSYEDNNYLYNDLEYSRNMLNGFPSPLYYDTHNDFRQKLPKQSVYDWLNTTQTDDYSENLRSDSTYTPDDATVSDARKFCTQWGKEKCRSFDDESTSESLDTAEESISNSTPSNESSKNKEPSNSNVPTNYTNPKNLQLYSTNTDDETQESVHDRIWRKSFYSRFNNRVLSRKERSFLEPEFLSESRLGLLNNLYNPSKSGYEKTELSKWDESNKSFQMKKKSKKHSPSFDKFESNSSLKKKHNKSNSSIKEMVQDKNPLCSKETEQNNDPPCSKSNTKLSSTAKISENAQPEH